MKKSELLRVIKSAEDFAKRPIGIVNRREEQFLKNQQTFVSAEQYGWGGFVLQGEIGIWRGVRYLAKEGIVKLKAQK